MKSSSHTLLRKQAMRGFSLIQVIVAAGILGILALFASKIVTQVTKSNLVGITVSSAEFFKKEIITIIEDDEAFQLTVAAAKNAGTLSCLIDLTDNQLCTDNSGPNSQGFLIQLLDRQKNVVFDSTDLSAGLRIGGSLCNTFNATNGNDSCPLRLEIRVKLVCPVGETTCNSPQVQIIAKFVYKPKTIEFSVPFNEARHSFTFVRNASGDLVAEIRATCKAIGGNFDATTLNCSFFCSPNQVLISFSKTGPQCAPPGTLIPDLQIVCPVGKFLVGLDSFGNKICRDVAAASTSFTGGGTPTASVTCPPGTALQTIDSSGNPVCVTVTSGRKCLLFAGGGPSIRHLQIRCKGRRLVQCIDGALRDISDIACSGSK